MPDNKVHHFVPKFHLRSFGTSKAISLFNIATRQHFTHASIRGQCQRSYLYGKDPALEKALCDLERLAATSIRIICGDDSQPYNISHHRNLLRFLLLQSLRTPSAVRHSQAYWASMKDALTRPHPSEPIIARTRLPGINEYNPDHLTFNLKTAIECAPVLQDLRPKIIENRSGVEFVTSDSPVILFNQASHGVKGLGNLGYTQTGFQVFFPMSPRKMLLLYDADAYTVDSNASSYIVVSNANVVQRLNTLQVLEADENLYYSGDTRTREAIDSIPTEHRRSVDNTPRSSRAMSEDERSILIHTYSEPHTYELRLPFISLKPSLKKKHVLKRVQSWRPEAVRIAEQISPPRDEPDETHRTKVWRTIDY